MGGCPAVWPPLRIFGMAAPVDRYDTFIPDQMSVSIHPPSVLCGEKQGLVKKRRNKKAFA